MMRKWQKEVDRVVAYETDRYKLRPCRIHFLDIATDGGKETTIGDTFMWNGKPDELTEMESGQD